MSLPAKLIVVNQEARKWLENGENEAALAAFKEAQEHHGKPSVVIENRIGNYYHAIGQYDLAIQHHSNALEIKDTVTGRRNRAYSYSQNNDCGPAITDAKTALTMEPEVGQGFHTDADSNWMLALCYQEQGNFQLALQHADVGLAIANENQYSDDEIRALAELRDTIRLEGNIPGTYSP